MYDVLVWVARLFIPNSFVRLFFGDYSRGVSVPSIAEKDRSHNRLDKMTPRYIELDGKLCASMSFAASRVFRGK